MGLCVTVTWHETVKNSTSYPRMDTVWIPVAEKPEIAQTIFSYNMLFYMVWMTGIEPVTYGLVNR
jgi:hypothetical protein